MRTTEERTALIHRRVSALKRERARRRLEGLCVAACLLLVLGAGVAMPGLTAGFSTGNANAGSETASMVAENAALGYILIGLLAFLLGICVTVLLYRLRQRYDHNLPEEGDDEF